MAPGKVVNVSFTEFHNIINGQPRDSKDKHQGIDPATREKLWDVPVATEEDVNDAVKAARSAFPQWAATPFEKRCEMVKTFGDLYKSYADEFISLLIKENGKPKEMAKGEVDAGYDFLTAATTMKLPTETYEDEKKIVKTYYSPLGIVAGICPWNFPIVLSAGKIGPALVAGDCIIIKPSPFTPYTALKLVEIGQQIFPPGVLQVLGGDDKLGPMLVEHPDIQKISFTGSIPTGKKIIKAAANTLKRVTAELGGNDACIVLPDVKIAEAAPKVAMAAFANSGQICVSSKRIYIHESIYKPFVEAMTGFVKNVLKVGAGTEEGVMIGPVQNEMQYDRVKELFADTKQKGYKIAHGVTEIESSKGYFITPTIIDNPPDDSRIVKEEPFGPIVPCQSYKDVDEVIRRANNTNTGLGGAVFGTNIEEAERVARLMDTGSVWINSWAQASASFFFGGHKESGVGSDWGQQGLLNFCIAQTVHIIK